ncbi:MAG: hypothetical protein U0528_01880 [Anaerolineae bacterium]
MNRSFIRLMALIMIIGIATPSTVGVRAQEAQYFYAIVATETTFEIVRIDVSTGSSSIVTSLPNRSTETFGEIAGEAEVKLAEDFFTSLGRDGSGLAQGITHANVRLIAAAPDGQTLAITIEYLVCYQYMAGKGCFGATRLLLLDTTSGELHTLFSIAFHDLAYKDICWSIVASTDEVVIGAVQWQSNEVIAIDIIGRSLCHLDSKSSAVIVLSTNEHIAPIRLANLITWTSSGDPQTIIGVHQQCPERITDPITCDYVISAYDFDLEQQTVNQVDYPTVTERVVVAHDKGMAWVEGKTIFQTYEFLYPMEGVPNGLGMLTPDDPNPVQVMLPLPDKLGNSLSRFASAPDGSIALAQTRDGKLWRLVFTDGKLQLTEFYGGSVSTWWWSPDNQLLVRSTDDRYLILDERGSVIKEIDVAAVVRSVKRAFDYMPLVTLDW